MIGFRQCDPRFPYLWEGSSQPAGRWHAEGEGPAHYFADTPDGAWAELLRHEEITDPADLATVRRAIWAVDLGDAPAVPLDVPPAATFEVCQAAARQARAAGQHRLDVSSAALLPGGARGRRVDDGGDTPPRDGRVLVLFGDPRDLRLQGWPAASAGTPSSDLLPRIRRYASTRG
jgi:RES domain-containing protein